jgi:hypothetical protein
MLVFMRITIEVDDGTAERPSGVVRWDRTEERFDGWIEFLRVLESILRRGRADPGKSTIRDSPGANRPDEP